MNGAQLCFANRDFAPRPVTGDLLGLLSPAWGGGQECRQGEWTIGCKLKLPLWGTENNRAKLKAGKPSRVYSFPKALS